MSHEVETMYYTSNEANGRFVPWHGLGTPVAEALTSQEALEAAGLNWEVESKPIFTDAGVQIPGYCANTRNTDNKVLGIVTDRYKIVQNSEAFSFTDALLGEGTRYDTAGSLRGGKQIWLLAKMPTTKVLGDDVDPFICFSNSHDGFGSIRVCMTPIRVVCNNTLNIALSTAKRAWSAKHIGDINSKLDEARRTLELANTYMEELADTADKLANTTVSDEKFNQIVDSLVTVPDDATDRMKKNADDLKVKFAMCYFAPDIAKFKNTAWGVINAASDFATHVRSGQSKGKFSETNWASVMNGNMIIDNIMTQVSAI